jgi:hypothetical protein
MFIANYCRYDTIIWNFNNIIHIFNKNKTLYSVPKYQWLTHLALRVDFYV